ncbi:MAG TPA: hypothetical protein VHI13_11200 [Candidatus Kapabacteria bacterium]|nr:hypothetical protein [Candidatus Kapabacteria bacterium]
MRSTAIIIALGFLSSIPCVAQPGVRGAASRPLRPSPQSFIHQTLSVSQYPNPDFNSWTSRPETVYMTITNQSGARVCVKLVARISVDGNRQDPIAVVESAPGDSICLNPGINRLYARDLIGSKITFSPQYSAASMRTGQLPAGRYEICITLQSARNDIVVVPQPVCASFSIAEYNPPVLRSPADAAVLALNQRPQFTWRQVTPPQSGIHYIVRVFQMLPGQVSSVVAMRANRPRLEHDALGFTQLSWPIGAEMLMPGRYVWTVQAIDAQGKPLPRNNGYAEPLTFIVDSGNVSPSGRKPEGGDSLRMDYQYPASPASPVRGAQSGDTSGGPVRPSPMHGDSLRTDSLHPASPVSPVQGVQGGGASGGPIRSAPMDGDSIRADSARTTSGSGGVRQSSLPPFRQESMPGPDCACGDARACNPILTPSRYSPEPRFPSIDAGGAPE